MNKECSHDDKCTPFTDHHPECLPGEIFLGNFTQGDAISIGWRSKRSGLQAYIARGSICQYQETHRILPYFASRSEIESAGVVLPCRSLKTNLV